MILAVVGSSSFSDYALMCSVLDEIDITEIVSGGAVGADTLARDYAKSRGIKLTEFLPNWKLYKNAAGMIRNKAIVSKCDSLIAFWDGSSKGTANSIDLARIARKLHKVIDVSVNRLF